MLADVNGNLLTLMMMGIHQDPLDEIVAVLVSSDVDEWNTRTIRTSGGNHTKISI